MTGPVTAFSGTRRDAVTLLLIGLLALNAVIYTAGGRAAESADAVAWFALLALYEWECRRHAAARRPRLDALLFACRLGAAIAIVLSAVTFLREQEWLDAINAWLWIGVVIVLEVEVRLANTATTHRRSLLAVSVLLYGGLAAVMLTWLFQGEWFDAYDASLWIAAFALIEMGLLKGNVGSTQAVT